MGQDILDDPFFDLEGQRPPAGRWLAAAVSLQMLGTLVAVILTWIFVESILGTGPTVSVLGGIVAILGRGRRWTRFLGFLPLGVSVICFFFIESLNWSPDDAYYPVGVFLSVTGTLSLLLGWEIIKKIMEDSK